MRPFVTFELFRWLVGFPIIFVLKFFFWGVVDSQRISPGFLINCSFVRFSIGNGRNFTFCSLSCSWQVTLCSFRIFSEFIYCVDLVLNFFVLVLKMFFKLIFSIVSYINDLTNVSALDQISISVNALDTDASWI